MTGLKARPARQYPADDQPVRGSLAEVAEQLHHTFGPQLTLAAAIDLAAAAAASWKLLRAARPPPTSSNITPYQV